jgi:long-chain acyl-CoA synthetase
VTAPRTLTEIFFGAVDRFRDAPVAMRAKRQGQWVDISYRTVSEQVQCLTAGLLELGIAAGDRVALLSENRPEWAWVDYACLAARCADVPIYPTLPPQQIAYILRDSGAGVIFVSSAPQLEKVLAIRHPDVTPALKHVVLLDEDVAGAPGVLKFGDIIARGRQALVKYPRWREDALAVRPEDLATLIYTSGTTGDPKGVMLTHGNITSNVVSSMSIIDLHPQQDECLSFLPLSHIFERMLGHYCMWHTGVIINYASSIDAVSAEMQERHPTIVASVPRLYEKIYARVLEGAVASSAVKKRIFFWARRTAEQWAEYALARRPLPRGLALKKRVADALVFSKLKQRTGGKLRIFVSGGAPLSAEIAKFFYAAGLPILEGYGLTETSPVIAVNTFDNLKIGTVGKPIPGVEVKIAPDGEILTRGPHVMHGYYNKPEATREAIDPDGWFHTGDIGIIDADGFLRITDRKKDLIVTAGGKNIAPQPIENRVKTNKFISNAVMLGDKRKYPILMVVPNMENFRPWAIERGLAFTDDASLVALAEAGDKIEREVRKTLRDLAQYEMPKKVMLLARDFSIEGGELTPTLKVKRRVVERNYQRQIEALYAEPEGGAHDVQRAGKE